MCSNTCMYVWLENGSSTTFCSSRMVEIEPVIPYLTVWGDGDARFASIARIRVTPSYTCPDQTR